MSANGTDYDLLVAFQDRLREKVPYSETQCFVTDEPVPLIWPSKGPWCTVCLGDQQFDPELYSGGGMGQLCQHTPVLVTAFIQSGLDHPPRLPVAMLDPKAGILTEYKPKILRALLSECDGKSDYPDLVVPWVPKSGGQSICRDGVVPVSCSRPTYMVQGETNGRQGINILGITLTFRCSFDWSL